MAWAQRLPGADVTGQVDSGVTALTYDANGNYSSGGLQFGTVAKYKTTGGINTVVATTTGDMPFGIVLSDPAAGPSEAVTLQVYGQAKVMAGGAISQGDLVYCTTNGQIATAPAPGVSQSYLVGRALEPASQAGDLIAVALMIGSATQVNA